MLLHAERHTPRDHITIPPYRILVSTQMIATALISNSICALRNVAANGVRALRLRQHFGVRALC